MESKELLTEATNLKTELQAFHEKLAEFELEREETRVVKSTLQDMSPSRSCFRQIAGVLVEGTVESIIPHLSLQESQLNNLIAQLTQQAEAKLAQLKELQQQIITNSNK